MARRFLGFVLQAWMGTTSGGRQACAKRWAQARKAALSLRRRHRSGISKGPGGIQRRSRSPNWQGPGRVGTSWISRHSFVTTVLTCGMRREKIICAWVTEPRLSRASVVCYTARACSGSGSTHSCSSIHSYKCACASARPASFICIDCGRGSDGYCICRHVCSPACASVHTAARTASLLADIQQLGPRAVHSNILAYSTVESVFVQTR